jgi:hypothetical protein
MEKDLVKTDLYHLLDIIYAHYMHLVIVLFSKSIAVWQYSFNKLDFTVFAINMNKK